jgi:hypothetical protein
MDRQNTIKLLDETFSSDFDISRFAKFVKELFNEIEIIQRDCTQFIAQEYRDYISNLIKIGEYEDKKKNTIEILVIKLKRTGSRDRARTMQRNFIASWLGKYDKSAALVAFYGDDEEDWRFSFVKMEYNLVKDEEGKVKIAKELTPAKRYSFLVGKNEPNHTCKRQFLELVMEDEINPSIGEIESAFCIDNVTKEFFSEYKELFWELNESLFKILEDKAHLRKEFEEKNISSVDFAKKLLGQIVFIYFLQKKGWLGVSKDGDGKFKPWGTGPKKFLRKLYDKEIVAYDNFFNDILEPLFYEALATERDDDYYSRFNCKIPFLNGGLFEPINDYEWVGTEITLGNPIFDRILSTFDRFNFTVKEDEPLEKEVAVDPEMLGKVFENLLEVKDRKSKGAFYTPREIVHYMCQQSLINYLETNSSIARDDIGNFIQLGDFALAQIIKEQEQIKKYGKTYGVNEKFSIPKSIKENHLLIDKLLKEIKIVDPAVGSGAFPVGMMNEIVKARSVLSIYFKEERKNYDLKREIIENCLYGVDIEPSAVEITKLRFWLSLIVDELDMKNIKPLPNLDHKIMCGNSLLEEFEGVKLFDEKLLGKEVKDIRPELNWIKTEIDALYLKLGQIETGKLKEDKENVKKEIQKLERQKTKLSDKKIDTGRNLTLDEATQNKIKESKKKLLTLKKLQREYFDAQNRTVKKQLREDIDRIEWELIEETLREQGNEEAMQKLKQYKKNKAKPFFLWKLYFAEVFQRENPGFDVVIANPPYIDYRKIDSTTKKGLFKFESFKDTKTGSIYVYFIELGMSLIRSKGILAFINPYQYLSADSGQGIRKLLIEKYLILRIVDISHVKVFAEASTYTCINIIINKYDENNEIEMVRCNNLDELNKNGFWIKQKNTKKDNYRIPVTEENNIIERLSKINSKLGNFCKIFCGTSEGGFGKKIINHKEYLSLNHTDRNEYSLVIQSSNTGKYFFKELNSFIPKDIFPNHVQSYFTQEKVFFARMTKQIRCMYTEEEYFGGKINVLVDFTIKPKYLLSVLNSSLQNYWYCTKFESKHLSGGYLGFDIPSVKEIPIKEIFPEAQKPFIQLVDQILSITKDDDYLKNPDKQAKVKKLEKEIDQLVYTLYELTPEEIKIVEAFGEKK